MLSLVPIILEVHPKNRTKEDFSIRQYSGYVEFKFKGFFPMIHSG